MANEQITFDKLPQAGRLSHRTDGTNPADGGGIATAGFFRQASSY